MSVTLLEKPNQIESLKITEKDKLIKLKNFQSQFVKSAARFPAFVAGWGTAKTLCAITKVIKLCNEFPNNLFYVLRKEWQDLKDSTLKDFEVYTGIKVPSSRDVVLPNGSTIMFRHLEEMSAGQGKGRNLMNINLGGAWIEQAEELESDEEFWMLNGRLRRANIPHCLMITANTNGHNWIYKLWKSGGLQVSIEKLKKDFPQLYPENFKVQELIEATTYDNGDVLPKEFMATIELLKLQKPRTYARMVLNSWDETDTKDLVIYPEWIQNAKIRSLPMYEPIKRVVSIDVGYGRDKTVFYAIQNNQQIGKQEWDIRDTMQICGYAVIFANQIGCKAFAVDEIGVGAGVKDRLKEMGFEVIEVNAAKASSNPEKYSNMRAEIYGYGSDLFQKGFVQIDPEDNDLIEQLGWTKFKSVRSNGRVELESKDDVRERYGRSPDNADSFLNGLWSLQFVNAIGFEKKKDVWIHERFRTDNVFKKSNAVLIKSNYKGRFNG